MQSIPFVVAFQAGQPVDAFQGAKDEAQVLDWLKELGLDLQAGAAVQDAPLETALGKAEALLRGRRFDELERIGQILGELEEDEDDYVAAQRLLEALPFFAAAWESAGPAADAAARAREEYAAGAELGAMHALFESLQEDRAWEDELARRAMVAIMHLHPEHEDEIGAMRRRLAVLLY